MDQLSILAKLSELRLLRDLADLSRHRERIAALTVQDRDIRNSLQRETDDTARLLGQELSGARALEVYANYEQGRRAIIHQQLNAATEAEAASLKMALRAHGRARAVSLLQDQAQEKRRVANTRRDEINNMSALTKPMKGHDPRD